ncbi:MAG: 50S ribosomal protein L19 [Firmicutes bacterium]|nr:50S ribosomal protein L19 [Bacillota bacterium]
MNNIIRAIEAEYMKKEPPKFDIGDTVKVWVKVVEGNRERLQAFEGTVIAKRSGSVRETFTVRRVSFGVGIERIFPLHSPRIDRVEVMRKGRVRRAKLYYLRNLSGKAAKVDEKIVAVTAEDKAAKAAAKAEAKKAKAVAPKATAKPKA